MILRYNHESHDWDKQDFQGVLFVSSQYSEINKTDGLIWHGINLLERSNYRHWDRSLISGQSKLFQQDIAFIRTKSRLVFSHLICIKIVPLFY